MEFFTGAGSKVMDISRVKMRLEGLMVYGTISALLMNASLRLASLTPRNQKALGQNATKYEVMAMDAFTLCTIVSVLSGSYTTVIFSMLALYSKRALGQGLDSRFLEFFAATEDLRESGFRSFIYSLISFETALLLSLYLNHKGKRRWTMVGFAFVISAISLLRWTGVMRLAGKILML